MSQVTFQSQNFRRNDFAANRPDPSQMKAQIDAKLKAAGATDDEIAGISGPQGVQTLAAKYGVNLPAPPQRQEGSIFDSQNQSNGSDMKAKIDSQLTNAGATSAEIAEAAANGFEGIKALADKYGVDLPKPPQRSERGRNGGNHEDMKAKMDSLLKAGGATDDEIAGISGPEDVKTLADKYGVTLPQPPQKNGSSGEVSESGGLTQILNLLTSLLGLGGTSSSTEDSTSTSADTSQLLLSLLGSLGSGNSILA